MKHKNQQPHYVQIFTPKCTRAGQNMWNAHTQISLHPTKGVA